MAVLGSALENSTGIIDGKNQSTNCSRGAGVKRRLKICSLALLGIVILAIAIVIVRFELWRRDVADRNAAASVRVATTVAGIVEFADYGVGAPVLWVHGTPGGYDQVTSTLRLSDMPKRYRSIVPSRPGYLGTPLESGKRVEEQARLFKALLDQLQLKRAAVVGSSGGGPYAIEFARQFPDSCSALILISAVTMSLPRKQRHDPSLLEQLFATPVGKDFGLWLVRESFPRQIKHIDLRDPLTNDYARAMIESAIPTRRRIAGFENDQSNLADLSALRLDQVQVPTLILHGTTDTNVPYAHAKHARQWIPRATLVTFEGYDHFIHITRREQIGAAMDEFLVRTAAD
jgi:pimeloyl-ACP methyl ester carboxylesterase